MILIFDLDDTLYVERSYVESGFKAVARFGEQRFGWEASASFDFMVDRLEKAGRGAVFNSWLAAHGKLSRSLVEQTVRIYRNHSPDISLPDESRSILKAYAAYPLYLVTDGHKIVQQKKVEALGIEPAFRKIFITHRYGIAHAKPSTHCFERIRSRERAEWSDLVYVGDNPAKDFVNLRRLGARTIRVLTGEHKDRIAAPGFDAEFRIATLSELPDVLPLLQHSPVR